MPTMRDRGAPTLVLPRPTSASTSYEYTSVPTVPDTSTPSPSKEAFLIPPSATGPNSPDTAPPSPWRTTFTPQHALAPAGSPHPFLRLRRSLVLVAGALVTASLLLLAPPTAHLSAYLPVQLRGAHATGCSAEAWSAGRWVPKDPPLTPNATAVDVFAASGFEGCTQDWFKPHWFLHTKEADWPNMDQYRWNAAQWRWKSDSEVCEADVRRSKAEELLQELVGKGGWILLGDSLSEQHFFSLGCVLFPHVYAVWGSGWWEQHMYIRADSPLLETLDLPPGFDASTTPIISNLRTDHGFTKEELIDIYESTPQSATVPTSQLFTDYPVQSFPIDDYLSRFFNATYNYHALIFSAAAHFTPREFAFPGGQPAIAPFYEAVVQNWTDVALEYLAEDASDREIVVRGASSGHDNCHEHMEPFVDEWLRAESYNWAEIPKYNNVFKAMIEKANHPRLSFLSLERPSQLRPDAHSEDCLHFAVGTGVFEGWTDYLAYFLRSRWRDRS
ncbi:uncharacterized protein JCM10292_001750 [Rhodotorula paludigena]|uniref:uncharacterized protein n=1 Tax=Rhodotorula paludigena TaxID=86838 RepID=UPI00317E794B